MSRWPIGSLHEQFELYYLALYHNYPFLAHQSSVALLWGIFATLLLRAARRALPRTQRSPKR